MPCLCELAGDAEDEINETEITINYTVDHQGINCVYLHNAPAQGK